MKHFFVYSAVNDSDISTSLGRPEYSYYFVLKEFLPVLQQLGAVTQVASPDEVDELWEKARKAGESGIFLSFSPPHLTRIDLKCPTIPVFAWEFDTLPSEMWFDAPLQNWAYGLSHWGKAIVHSEMTATATRRLMGEHFPVTSIPAPLWDRMSPLREATLLQPGPIILDIAKGVLKDTRLTSLDPYRPGPDFLAEYVARSAGKPWPPQTTDCEVVPDPTPDVSAPTKPPQLRPIPALLRITIRYLVEWYRLVLKGLLGIQDSDKPSPDVVPIESTPEETLSISEFERAWLPQSHQLELEGVIFTSVFNPYDGRKNWRDILSAFCDAFKDREDVVLVCKLTHQDYRDAMEEMLSTLARFPAFKCRVVLLHGYLTADTYQRLMATTAFIVNASHGEGQCLPLMEYLSIGKPAIAPCHSAMADYIDDAVGFVVSSWPDATAWPHDPRVAYRTLRHQIDWESLREAFVAADICVREDPERYQKLSQNAIQRMQTHCSQATAAARLQALLDQPACVTAPPLSIESDSETGNAA